MNNVARPGTVSAGLAPRRNWHDPEAGVPLGKLVVSFEFFPPTDPEMEVTLWNSVRRLSLLAPRFVSVTYGADGSTRDRTLEVVRRLRIDTSLTVAPHVTSVGSSRDEILNLARRYWKSGIRHIVALRGDEPNSNAGIATPLETFRWGLDLVRGLRSVADFDISVAAYPEMHPQAASAKDDLDNLRAKIDAGATRAITQFFFDNGAYLRFRDACAAAGITAPIVPGILPINRFSQVQRFARRCGASIPAWLSNRFEGLDDDVETRRLLGAAVAVDQVEHLQRHGVREFHFYTLNRADLTYAICHALGIRPGTAAARSTT
jgi:methylenetetrahydrofolate reductase (NADPH)